MEKRIVYTGEFVLPDKSAAANRVVSNGKIFASLGYKTVFLGASGDDTAFDGVRPVEHTDNMYEQAHPKSSKEWIKHIFSTKNLEELVAKTNASMVIAYNLPIITLLRIKSAFKKKGIKIAYDCTEWSADTNGSFLKRLFKKIDEWFVRNTLGLLCDNIIVISDLMAGKYSRCKNLIKLPPLVDINSACWHQAVTENDKFEFCFAGGLDGNKESLDKVIEAFSSIENADVVLNVVGITKQDFVKAYPTCKAASDTRINFVGAVSHDKSVEYILNSDCYVFVRVADRRNNAGFPTKFAESYTAGTNIITTATSDIANYYKTGEIGTLLADLSVADIRSAILAEIGKGKRKNKGELRKEFDITNYIGLCEKFLSK